MILTRSKTLLIRVSNNNTKIGDIEEKIQMIQDMIP